MSSSTTNNMIASSLAQINVLLEKTADWDKDERYMATNDLCQLLSKDIKIDESMEAKICTAVLKQLDDASNDVQSVAVKCLAIITKKVQQNQIVEVCKKLIVQILDGKEALRDVYSIGLKTLIADVSDTMGPMICQHLSQKLILGISRKDSEAVQRECLDNMSDLLKRFGQHNSEYHNSIMTVVIEHLKSDKAVIRKRAIVCLGSLVVVASDALLNTLVQSFLQQIEEGSRLNTKISQQSTRTLVQAIGTMSRTVGYRLGKHLSRIVPMFLKCIGTSDDESLQNDGSNELREYCFPGIESFLLRCPKEASPFINQILTVSIEFMKYDPNYAYDDDDDDDDENADEDVEMDCDEDNDDDDNNIDDEYAGGSDDDDSSWKVRKAAVKVIQAIISTRTELLDSIYELCGKQLISRFKEREENVRLDIMACYAVFLSARPNSYNISTFSSSSLPSSSLSTSSTSSVVVVRSQQQQQQQQQQNQLRHINKTVSLPLLISSTSAVVKASCVQLASPSLRSRSAAFSVLRQFTVALHGGLDTYLSRIIPLLQKGLEEKGNQTVKLDALMLYRSLLELHSPLVMQGSVKRLLLIITSILKEEVTEWYKVVAETLRVINAMISIIRPVLPTNTGFDDSYPQLPVVMDQIYKAIISKFNALDIDYETKDCVIATMTKLLHYADDHLFCYNEQVFGVLKKRLDNETTRVPTLKGLIMIASSPLHIDLTAFLEEIAPDLSMLLRQSSRALKQQALYTIGALTTTTTNTVLSPIVVTLLFTELSTVLSDVDIHLTHLALELIISIIKKDQDVSDAPLHAHIFSKLIILARSSLLQGQALTSLLSLYQHITEAKKMSTTNYNDLFNQLYLKSLTTTTATSSSRSSSSSNNNNNNTNSDLNKAGIANLSKCIACITIHSGQVIQTIEKLITDLSDLLNESITTTTTGVAAAAVGVSTGGSPKKTSSSNNNTNNNDNNTNNSTNLISNHKIQLALLTIGEIGQQHDLSNITQLNKLILKCFEGIHHSEDIKLAAAFCLGHIAVGNMNVFLPFILNTDRSSGRNQYLLLVSLKEILIIFSNNNINCEPYLSSILPILINQCNSDDDSVHTVVADCLGLLACLLPIVIFPSLLELITSNTSSSSGGISSSKYGRYIAINAIRFSLAYATCSMETLVEINKNMKLLLPLLVSKGEDLNVKKAMLQMINTAIHHHTDVVREYISSSSSSSSSSGGEEGVIVLALVETLKIKLERVVDLGPFKHRVDDNLPLRVVALTCIESILDNCPDALDYSLVMSIMPLLLAEKDEIQSKKAQQILMKLSIYSPSAVITSIDDLIPLLNKLLNPPVKKNVEGDTPMSMVEIDKVNDLIKSCLRTVVAVNAIEDISVVSRKWLDFYDRIKKDKKLNEMINSLDSDKTLDFYNV